MTVEAIFQAFPDLSERQRAAFEALGALYSEWNARINVVSRRDIDNLYERHVMHSLAIAAFWGKLEPGTTVMDLGTGGGFPGIPLAIMYPQVHFHLIDRIAKKLTVATDVARAVGLDNVTMQHGDSGECHERFDYVVSRAVMSLDRLITACRRNIVATGRPGNRYATGLVCLKGGDLADEVSSVRQAVIEMPLSEVLPAAAHTEWMQGKQLVYVPMGKNAK